MDYPLGIADVDIADLINIDEMELFLESTNITFLERFLYSPKLLQLKHILTMEAIIRGG